MKVETSVGRTSPKPTFFLNQAVIMPRSQSTLAKNENYSTTRSKSPFDMMKGIS